MRQDLNKLLCEHERYGSKDHYRYYRKLKKFNPRAGQEGENLPAREGMRLRYGWDRKSFGENLNPLYGAIRKAVGRKWDKFYSELCSTFNMRSVINQHILVHLYQYIEVDTVYVDGGELWVRSAYRAPQRLRNSGVEYYVDPRDGIIKKNKWMVTYKAARAQREAEAKRKEAEVFRDLSDGTVLRNIDGVWFQFTMKTIPAVKVTYERPSAEPDRKYKAYSFGKEKYWEQLTDHERQRFGIRKLHGETVRDEFYNTSVYFDETRKICVETGFKNAPYNAFKNRKYHADKRTASHKVLKQAGIV